MGEEKNRLKEQTQRNIAGSHYGKDELLIYAACRTVIDCLITS
jgi:hypothetical protein